MSESTVARLEKGDAGVSIGTLTMACVVLGEIDRIAEFLDPDSDDTGLLLDRESLPKRIDGKRKSNSSSHSPDEVNPIADGDDEERVGF